MTDKDINETNDMNNPNKTDIKNEEEKSRAEDKSNNNTSDESPEEKPQKEEPSREEQLETEIAELKDQLLRRLAEFDNFRKRTTAEKASMYSVGRADTVEKLLPVLDNFERALSTEKNKEDSFYKGVEMIFRQMVGALEAMGIKEIEAEGKLFDPNRHNAVMHVENEELGENVVSAVLQKGYTLGERVIRPAMVCVAN